MEYRSLGRTGWKVSVMGYGMWGMGGWSGSNDEESLRSLEHSVQLGCNFFDTAWIYGDGRSERLLGELIRAHSGDKLYVATKIPPKNLQWPARREDRLKDVFPTDHIHRYVESSLKNLGLEVIDLIQFHVWTDEWTQEESWQRAMDDLKRDGLVRAVGISVNRWEPENCIKALRTGLIDAVQVIYNIFDQSPEDELYPVCRELNVGVIARVPFDEGTLTGTLTLQSSWPKGDWRNTYFGPENLKESVRRAEILRASIPQEMTMPDVALRFIISNPDVSTIIPGMRKLKHVESNFGAAQAGALDDAMVQPLRAHRWDRRPANWSD